MLSVGWAAYGNSLAGFDTSRCPPRTTRQEARARILSAFTTQLDRVIPTDENVPLKGAMFADFEDQVETLAQAALPVALEERAALEAPMRK